jgi:folate-binding protein YgfZ
MEALRRARLNPRAPRDNQDAPSADAKVARMAAAKDPPLVPLDRAELIEISGADAIAFAHAQFASDVAGLEVDAWQWSAWLNAQGRTRAVFALLRIADHLLVWLPLGGATKMRDALARFVLRAKVGVALRDGWSLCRSDKGTEGFASGRRLAEYAGGYAFTQPGPSSRVAWLGPARDVPVDALAREAWRLADIAAGLPWLSEATGEEFVPQALDLGRLDAVRFDKGCYPGQEIAARLHFKGGNKHRLHRISLIGEGDAMPGLRIESTNGNAGTVLYSACSDNGTREALAVLSDASKSLPLRSDAGHIIITKDSLDN